MERHNGIEFDPEGAFVYYDDAQRVLDAEREKVKEYMTNYVPLKALEDVEAQLATLQAQLRQVEAERDAIKLCLDALRDSYDELESRRATLAAKDAGKAVSSG